MMIAHVCVTISTCTRSIYALKTYRPSKQGLYDVCRAKAISRLMYASPAWWGYTFASDKSEVQAMVSKCFLSTSSLSALSIASQADAKLLQSVFTNHYLVLFPLFTPKMSHKYQLRTQVPTSSSSPPSPPLIDGV